MLQLTEVNHSASKAIRKLSRLKTWNLWAISDNVPARRLGFLSSLILCVRTLSWTALQNCEVMQGITQGRTWVVPRTWLGFFVHDVLCGSQHGGPRQRISPWKRRTEKRKGLQRKVFKGKYCYIVFLWISKNIVSKIKNDRQMRGLSRRGKKWHKE